MAQEKIIINEDAYGEYTAVVYDGKMRIFLKQHIKNRNAAFAEVRKFLKEQQEMIESEELLLLED